MTDADRIRAVGELLWGNIWQTEMQRALEISDSATIRKWASGARKVPIGVWPDLQAVCASRRDDVDKAVALMQDLSA